MTYLAQKAGAILLGAVSSVVLFVIYTYPRLTVFATAIAFWFIVLAIGVLSSRRLLEAWRDVFPLAYGTAVACVGLFLLMEWRWWQWMIMACTGGAVAFLYGWSVPDETRVGAAFKPFRRVKMMLWVFDAYAIVTGLIAFGVFFPRIPAWSLFIAEGAVFGGVSYMIWRMYYDAGIRELVLWVLLVAVIMVEILWAIQLLPFAYLVTGFLATWIWYVLQLLIRFHIGPQDVVWGRQRWFLVGNAFLFAAVMYLARWV